MMFWDSYMSCRIVGVASSSCFVHRVHNSNNLGADGLRWRRTGKHLLASNAGPVETERNHKDGEGQLDVEANLSQIFKEGPKLKILTTLLAPMRRKEMATRMEDATR